MIHVPIPFTLDHGSVAKIADALIAAHSGIDILALGEALHGGEEILILRNLLFQHLVEHHGFLSIALETSFVRSDIVNDYVTGRTSPEWDELTLRGFGHGFGSLEANRELVDWMRAYNASDPTRQKVHFYGLDMPTGNPGPTSPREAFTKYLGHLDRLGACPTAGERIEESIGAETLWQDPSAWHDPERRPAMLQRLESLKKLSDELAHELSAIQASDDALAAARHAGSEASGMLHFYSALAHGAGFSDSLAVRDVLMADNVSYILTLERHRGPIMLYAHNMHLKRSDAIWKMGDMEARWQPAGTHLAKRLGQKYLVVGTAIGTSPDNGIGTPEPDTLEAFLTRTPGPNRLIPSSSLPTDPTLRTRPGSAKNPSWFPLDAESRIDYDWIAMFDSVTYNRGGRALG